ncbi:hypothetical protein D3C79_904440 [compost metagenome]
MHRVTNGRERCAQLLAHPHDVSRRLPFESSPALLWFDYRVEIPAVGDVHRKCSNARYFHHHIGAVQVAGYVEQANRLNKFAAHCVFDIDPSRRCFNGQFSWLTR